MSMISGYAKLIQFIKQYESDTFSASQTKLKPEEAEQIADLMISFWQDSEVDGVFISELLETIRMEP